MNKQIAIIYVLIASMILNVFVSNFDALAANVDNTVGADVAVGVVFFRQE